MSIKPVLSAQDRININNKVSTYGQALSSKEVAKELSVALGVYN